MPPASLTSGAIRMICAGEADLLKPLLQVVDIRLVNTAQNTSERYRMVLSDGIHLQHSVLATQLNHVVKSGRLQKSSIVRLTEFICNVIQSRKIIIIINLEVVVEKADLIGDPKLYAEGNNMRSSVAPAKVATPERAVSMDQPGTGSTNPWANAGPFMGSASSGPNSSSGSMPQSIMQHGGIAQSCNGSSGGTGFSRNVSDGIHPYPKAEYDATSTSGYANQLQKFGNNNANSMSTGASRSLSNSYGQSAPSSYNSPPSICTNRGPIAKNESPAQVIPIAALNPYQGRWTIKGCVTKKSEVRRFSSSKVEGKVFSFDLLDSSGGEIRATCFNAVCDQFYSQVESGKVYLISKGALKPAKKEWNHLNNDWEIHLELNSTIQVCPEEDSSIPRLQFNFRPIVDVESMENGAMLDVIAVLFSISPSITVLKKDGTETTRRSLQLKDMSGRSVELVLWGDLCNAEGQQLQDICDAGNSPVLAVRTARINVYQGKRNLGTVSSSQIFINPEVPEAHNLLEWYNTEGKIISSVPISGDYGRNETRKTVSQIKDEGLGRSEKADWITVNATILFIKAESVVYPACPLMSGDRRCNKKAINIGDGMWHCEKCDQSFPQCDYCFRINFQIGDHTGITWVTAFQEVGEEMFGISAKEMYTLKFEEFDDARFSALLRGILFTRYLFRLKVMDEAYGDEQRVKSTVYKAEKISFPQESKYLLSLIDGLSVEESHAACVPPVIMAGNTGMPPNDYMSFEKADLIGDTKLYAEGNNMNSSVVPAKVAMPERAVSMDQPGTGATNSRAHAGPFMGSASSGPNISSGSMPQSIMQHGGIAQSCNGSSGGPGFSRNISDGIHPYPKAEYDATSTSGYANQLQKFGNNNANSVSTGASRSLSNSYGQSAPSSYNSPPSICTNRGPIAKNESPARVIPIAALNPYQGRWTIKGRVTKKSEVRRFSSSKVEGKVFSFDLLDSSGGEIRATCFNAVCDQFYSQVESGKVYLISKGALKPAKKEWNHLNNDWEIHLELNSTIQVCPEEDSSIPRLQFNFRPIVDVESMENGAMLDVIAVLFSISPSITVRKKDGTETTRRSLQLKDMSGRSVELVLWGDLCNAEGQQLQDICDAGNSPVLAVRTARINVYQGKRNLGTVSSSQIFINPEFPEAHNLLEWYNTEGKIISSVPISGDYGRNETRKTVSQIKDEGLGRSEKADWITVNATILFIKAESVVYPACPLMSGDRRCNKKAINNSDGMWHCEKCDQSFPQCNYCFLINFQIGDHTGVTWVTAFQEVGEEMFGISAKEMYTLKFEEFDDARFSALLRGILFTRYLFRLKVMDEAYGDEQRVKSTVYKAEKISFPQESKYLLSLIDGLSVEESHAACVPPVIMAGNTGMPPNDYISV